MACLICDFLGLVALYKVFMALQVLVGLSIPAIVLYVRKKDLRLIYLGLLTGTISAMIIIYFWINTPYTGKFFEFNPWYMIYYFFTRFSHEHSSTLYSSYSQWMFKNGLSSFLLYFFGYGLFFILGSMWLRILGLKKWLGDLVNIKKRPGREIGRAHV